MAGSTNDVPKRDNNGEKPLASLSSGENSYASAEQTTGDDSILGKPKHAPSFYQSLPGVLTPNTKRKLIANLQDGEGSAAIGQGGSISRGSTHGTTTTNISTASEIEDHRDNDQILSDLSRAIAVSAKNRAKTKGTTDNETDTPSDLGYEQPEEHAISPAPAKRRRCQRRNSFVIHRNHSSTGRNETMDDCNQSMPNLFTSLSTDDSLHFRNRPGTPWGHSSWSHSDDSTEVTTLTTPDSFGSSSSSFSPMATATEVASREMSLISLTMPRFKMERENQSRNDTVNTPNLRVQPMANDSDCI